MGVLAFDDPAAQLWPPHQPQRIGFWLSQQPEVMGSEAAMGFHLYFWAFYVLI